MYEDIFEQYFNTELLLRTEGAKRRKAALENLNRLSLDTFNNFMNTANTIEKKMSDINIGFDRKENLEQTADGQKASYWLEISMGHEELACRVSCEGDKLTMETRSGSQTFAAEKQNELFAELGRLLARIHVDGL